MDAKRVAMVLGIMIMLPLFLGLFFDAVYEAPVYEDYCQDRFDKPYMVDRAARVVNCTDPIYPANFTGCDDGIERYTYDENGCSTFDRCDYCNTEYEQDTKVYNRNLFFILAPIGLVIIVVGIYFWIDYMGAGFMFGGLITLFYATIRHFTDMSKLLRALVILAELLVIIWLGIKKIGTGRAKAAAEVAAKPPKTTVKPKAAKRKK